MILTPLLPNASLPSNASRQAEADLWRAEQLELLSKLRQEWDNPAAD